MVEFNLLCIFIILLVVLSLKLYLQYSNYNTYKCNCNEKCNCKENGKCNCNGNCNCNEDGTCNCNEKCNCNGKCNCNEMSLLLNKVKIETQNKINSVSEQGAYEGFTSYNQSLNNNNNNIISYINKDEKKNLMLFYKPNCTYCNDFLSVWYKIINYLPNNINYEEINTEKDEESNQKANQYKITGVPTLILNTGNKNELYIGNRSYEDIELFLNKNGIILTERTFEEFDDTGYGTEPKPTDPTNPNCPAVTFDSQLDVENDDYMFQIFNSQGQYGYATGGNKERKLLTPFAAAYSVVDSYLSSLPDSKNMEECSTLYSRDIRGFGLCDREKLDEILEYEEKVKNGSGEARFIGTNYKTNNDIVKAIKESCNL